MGTRPLVSIIIPIYKTEQYLARCIVSLLNQSYRKLEIILVNDGSPDKSPHICDNFAILDSRIKVIHKENGGISSARNAGLQIMTGDYVTFVDSDDFIHSDCIRRLVYYAVHNKSEIVQCGYISGYEDHFYHVDIGGRSQKYTMKKAFLSRKLKSGVVGKLYKASLFRKERFVISDHFNYEDEGIFYRLIYQAKSVTITSQKLYYYYQSKNSTTRNQVHYQSRDFIDVFDNRLIFFQKKDQELYQLTQEYFSLNLMLFYMKCKKDKFNTNDLREVLSRYRKLYPMIMNNKVTPLLMKIMFTLFYMYPSFCTYIVHIFKLR